jgi:oxalate decarboxylase/phosphoglucose isomerase-like protein (cupin superfamily)
MSLFTQVILYTDNDGRAKFREEKIDLNEGTPQSMLSAVLPATGCQLRQSPVGFRSQFHCTSAPQWLFVLSGEMKIGLQDGSTRSFKAGDHFYSADLLPASTTFRPDVHGHSSCQVGEQPLVTLFIKV